MCVEEDIQHSVIRAQKCSNEKATDASLLLKQLNRDCFLCPSSRAAGEEYRWCGRDEGQRARVSFMAEVAMTEDEAREYMDLSAELSGTPEEYGKGIRAIIIHARHDMHRREGKGKNSRTLAQVIEANLDHYSFYRNCTVRRSRMTSLERSETSIGTTSKSIVYYEGDSYELKKMRISGLF